MNPTPPAGTPRPAVFLDRDGTINEEVDYLTRVEDMRLLPGAAEAIARLREAGFTVVVVTNQSAVARGMMAEAQLVEIHEEMRRQLAAGDAEVDAICYCPHHPDHGEPPYRQDCSCRKPKPGLLHRAAEELGIDLSRSVMIGDKTIDLETGWNAGCRSILVRTGYGEEALAEMDRESRDRIAFVAGDLLEAADWLLARPD
ncbi:MAG: D-glycero-beta-D-manno-heptose 1,7-bisphosphate 7-phosphatase [Candidatus Latescibacteria bacterium]|jgi:D-glycero-D-manno-heptose 1,7-bisphosphate phosphatase|nr:D-glycero-beta-D-manno-heptose 1,7-bisphosphate 7-phosphatase [Candidatus Latescibacterota bacterium]